MGFFGVTIVSLLSIRYLISSNYINQWPIKSYLCLCMLWLWSVLSVHLSGASGNSVYSAFVGGRFVIVLGVLPFAISMVYKRFQNLRPFFHIHFLWISVFAIYQAFTGIYLKNWSFQREFFEGIYRSKGFFSNTMTFSYVFAIWFAYFLPFIWASKSKKGFRSILLLLCAFLMFCSLVLTQTRGMWIALVVVGVFFLYLYGGKNKILKSIGMLAALFIVVLVVPTLRERFFSIFNPENLSNSIRLELWSVHWEIIKENWLFGAGGANKIEVLKAYYSTHNLTHNFLGHAHNNLLEITARGGLLGLSLYLAGFGGIFVYQLKMLKNLSHQSSVFVKASLAGQIVFHVGGMTECTFLDYEVVYSLVVVISLGILSCQKSACNSG